MLLYETRHSGDEILAALQATDFNYATHLHKSLEFVFCMNGMFSVTIDGCAYAVPEGQGALIPANVLHSYETKQSCSLYCLLVGSGLLRDVAELTGRSIPERYTFEIDPVLRVLLEEYYSTQERMIFNAKAILYRASQAFVCGNSFTPQEVTGTGIAVQMITYMQENFREPLTLETFAGQMDYDYFYISKLFRQNFGKTFSELLSDYRIGYAKTLLEERRQTISEIALASGFGSIRSFNRTFRQITGMSPSAYLQSRSAVPTKQL